MRLHAVDKTVLRLNGGARKFLEGLSSNSLEAPRNAFLNIHGRIVATFDQVRVDDNEVLIAPEAPFVEPLLEHIAKYLKINHTTAQRTDLHAYFNLEMDYVAGEGEWRVPQRAGQLIFTPRELSAHAGAEEFLLFRVRAGIPVHGIDYRNEMILNVSETEFVSFSKGCFLGQEPVAKVHHRARPSWRLTVCREEECSAEQRAKMTSRVTDPRTRQVAGFVFVPYGDPA